MATNHIKLVAYVLRVLQQRGSQFVGSDHILFCDGVGAEMLQKKRQL